MQPALHQDLVAAQLHGLADLLEQHVAVEDVGVGGADLAVEGAEVADRGADVGVVDVPVDVVGAERLGMEPPADRVGGAAQLQQRGRTEQLDPLVETDAIALNGARKIAATVEDKVHSFRGQSEPGRHAGERPQPGDLGLAEVVGQHLGQVIVTRREVESQARAVRRGQFGGMRQALGPAPLQRLGQVAEVDAAASHPEGEDERQAGQTRPRPPPDPRPHGTGRRGTFIARSPITSTASAVLSSTETPSGSSSTIAGRTPCRCIEPDPRQRLAGPRPGVERQPLDLRPRHPAEQLDAPHRPPGRDREAREDLVAAIDAPEVLDRRDQRDVQLSRRPVARPAGSGRPWTAAHPGANSQSR